MDLEGGGGGGGGGGGQDPDPLKSQVAIGFLSNSGTDTPRVQLLLEGGPYSPL